MQGLKFSSELVKEDEKYQSQRANPFLCRSPLFADMEVGLATPPDYKAGYVSDEETVWFTPQEVATPAVKDSEVNTLQRDRSPIPRMKKIQHSSPDSITEESDRTVTSDVKVLGTSSDKEVFGSTPTPAFGQSQQQQTQAGSTVVPQSNTLEQDSTGTSSDKESTWNSIAVSSQQTPARTDTHEAKPFLGLELAQPKVKKLQGADLIKSRLSQKAKQRANSNQCTKREVLLTTFDTSNGDEDGSIREARESIWRAWMCCESLKDKHELYETVEALVRSVNEGSSKFIYTFEKKSGDALKDSFSSWYVGIKWEYITPDDVDQLKKLGLHEKKGVFLYVGLFDPMSNTIYWCVATKKTSLKLFLKYYAPKVANRLGTSSSSLWFEYKNSALFSSDNSRKMEEFDDGDLVYVSLKKERSPLKSLSDNKKVKPLRSKAKKKKHKPKGKRSRQVVQPTKSKEELEEEAAKQSFRIWMDNIGRVLSEAQPLFKKKREKLNELNLERTKPKQKKVIEPNHVHEVDEQVNNPRDLGGKAGKTHFHVLVGEASNLYKTAKTSVTSKKVNSITIDLHRCTKSEALSKLNSSLPVWVDTAMKGDYPFILPVTIICGAGSQILAEVVEKWVKSNGKVANAPKKLHS